MTYVLFDLIRFFVQKFKIHIHGLLQIYLAFRSCQPLQHLLRLFRSAGVVEKFFHCFQVDLIHAVLF
jgi:hypothetical protein